MAEIVTSITEQIDQLIQYKTEIARAINAKNSSAGLTADSPLSEFAEKINEISGGDPKLEELNATSNGTYTPSGDNVGFSRVTVNVSSGSGSGGGSGSGSGGGSGSGSDYDEEDLPEYTVTFKSEADEEWSFEESVKYGNNAQGPSKADIPEKEGYKFLSWQPAPNNVTADLTTNAKYKALSASLDDVSWAEIVESGGAIAEIGDYKLLRFGKIPIYPISIATWNYNPPAPGSLKMYNVGKTLYYTASVRMMKIGENEEGASSTWMACEPIKYTPTGSAPTNITYPFSLPNDIQTLLNEGDSTISYGPYNTNSSGTYENKAAEVLDMDGIWWKNSFIRDYLNNILLPAMDESVQSYIKSVTKYSTGQNRAGSAFATDLTTNDKLWLPSNTEIWGSSADYGSKGVYYNSFKSLVGFPRSGYGQVITRDRKENENIVSISENKVARECSPIILSTGLYFGFCL